mmetsp:Transcript_11069/g.40542  ORF Transcript_11069/g.40542 Transcript_11069/m.40542 type:complete len:139 (-) Transcript_11069:2918-3334(-)
MQRRAIHAFQPLLSHVEIAGRNRRARLSEQRHKVQSDELVRNPGGVPILSSALQRGAWLRRVSRLSGRRHRKVALAGDADMAMVLPQSQEEQELVTLSVEELRAMLMSAEGPKEIKWQSACALAVLHLQDYPFRRTDQ